MIYLFCGTPSAAESSASEDVAWFGARIAPTLWSALGQRGRLDGRATLTDAA
jgi:hypothetical protein